MQEKTFFDHNDIRVTNTRFIVGNQTFVMSNISSVKLEKKDPDRLWPLFSILIGLLILLFAGLSYAPGLIVLGLGLSLLGVGWLIVQKSNYWITLSTAGGERKVYTELDFGQKIVQALNEAIVYRR